MKLKKKEGLDPLFLYNKSMQFIKFFICLLLISSCGGGGGGGGGGGRRPTPCRPSPTDAGGAWVERKVKEDGGSGASGSFCKVERVGGTANGT